MEWCAILVMGTLVRNFDQTWRAMYTYSKKAVRPIGPSSATKGQRVMRRMEGRKVKKAKKRKGAGLKDDFRLDPVANVLWKYFMYI